MLALHGLDVPGFVIETTSLARAALAALGMHLNWLEARTGYLPAAWNVLWSLSVEEAFYLAFPLLCMLALATGERLLKLTLLLFVALGPFARVAFPDNEIWADHSIFPAWTASPSAAWPRCTAPARACADPPVHAVRRRSVRAGVLPAQGDLRAGTDRRRPERDGAGNRRGLAADRLEPPQAEPEPPGLCLAFLRWMGVNSYRSI